MSQNVAEFVWQRLSEWGLSRVYGYPGDGVGGLDVALEKAKDFMQYVQVRHEEMAAFMASAHAKFTGEVGLCYATSGPGAIHLLTGLYDAKTDHVPVVAIVGQQARTALGAQLPAGSRSADPVQGRGGRFCRDGQRAGPGPPPDRPRRAHRHDQAHRHLRHPPQRPSGAGLRGPARGPWRDPYRRRLCRPSAAAERRRLLQRAADVLNAGKKVAMLVGAGACRRDRRSDRGRGAAQAGVAKALLGKAAVPDDLP